MNRLKVLIIIVTVQLALLGTSCERSGVEAARETPLTAQEILSMDDKEFLMNAEKSEIRQRALAETALAKSTNADIREFANQVAGERRRDLEKLKAVMKSKGFAQQPAREEELQLEAINRLHRLTGSALDHEFIGLITAEQQQSVGTFDRAAETAADPDVRTYANEVLPTLQKDFDAAAALETKLGVHTR